MGWDSVDRWRAGLLACALVIGAGVVLDAVGRSESLGRPLLVAGLAGVVVFAAAVMLRPRAGASGTGRRAAQVVVPSVILIAGLPVVVASTASTFGSSSGASSPVTTAVAPLSDGATSAADATATTVDPLAD